MTVRFVTRHAGAIDWALSKGIPAERVAHLDPSLVRPGDVVIGALPAHLAAEICERGGRYLHLALDLPEEMRGVELTAADMSRYGARLVEIRATVIDPNASLDDGTVR